MGRELERQAVVVIGKLIMESAESPFEDHPPLFLRDLALGSGRAERPHRSFDSVQKCFRRMVIPHRFLGRSLSSWGGMVWQWWAHIAIF